MNQDADQPPIQGYVDPNFPNPNGDQDVPIIIYGYTPSFASAAFAAVWFAVLLVAHSVQLIRRRCWWWLVVDVGLVFEIIGYIARSLSAKQDPYNLPYFVLNYFFIVTAPVFIAAGIYTTLSVLLQRLSKPRRLLSPKLILGFFITSDVIATGLQVAGAALIGTAESDRKDPTTANNILLGGLAYQVFSMGVFVVLMITLVVQSRQDIKLHHLSTFIVFFSISTLLIYLRTAFRLAETASGLFSEVATREVYFACLEFAPVALALLILAVFFPGKHLRRKPTEPAVV